MNTTTRASAIGIFAAGLTWASFAQDERPEPPTMEQRIAALEAAVAALDMRLALEVARPDNTGVRTDIALEGRVVALERSLDRLADDVQRAQRLAENAARAASDAQRDAIRAEQAARDAALRSR